MNGGFVEGAVQRGMKKEERCSQGKADNGNTQTKNERGGVRTMKARLEQRSKEKKERVENNRLGRSYE
ncbi:hypothetical protein DVS31_11765 [Limosilactobacillus fermentum]|nr:hypothetical protein [Limosilactobacillus fermentum]